MILNGETLQKIPRECLLSLYLFSIVLDALDLKNWKESRCRGIRMRKKQILLFREYIIIKKIKIALLIIINNKDVWKWSWLEK